jgi:hypothetical protein
MLSTHKYGRRLVERGKYGSICFGDLPRGTGVIVSQPQISDGSRFAKYTENLPDRGQASDLVTQILREAILDGTLQPSSWLRELVGSQPYAREGSAPTPLCRVSGCHHSASGCHGIPDESWPGSSVSSACCTRPAPALRFSSATAVVEPARQCPARRPSLLLRSLPQSTKWSQKPSYPWR